MAEFEREMPSYRLAETHAGDTLQRVAAREMGDANRWPELVWINNLTSPYLTDIPAEASATVLLTGSMIRIPAPTGINTDATERAQVYERDCKMVKRRLTDDGNGDFAVVSGTDNLKQQLTHRIVTPRGQLVRHADYGCLVWLLQGKVAGPTAGLLGAQYVKAALQADYRVSSVTSSTAEVDGDTTRITATAEAIAGGKVDISNQ
nr:MAG TPA: Baseplate wedge protein [Caudoviricetes sp.]